MNLSQREKFERSAKNAIREQSGEKLNSVDLIEIKVTPAESLKEGLEKCTSAIFEADCAVKEVHDWGTSSVHKKRTFHATVNYVDNDFEVAL